MSKSKRLHVTPHPDGWAVQREKGERASAIADTKAEAEKIARDLAKQEKGEVVIHGKDGKIQDSDSYGNDPVPPIDKKH
jgi:uncharacterized protein YdaT